MCVCSFEHTESGGKVRVPFSSLHVTLCRPQCTPSMAKHGCGSLTNGTGQGVLLKEVMLKLRVSQSYQDNGVEGKGDGSCVSKESLFFNSLPQVMIWTTWSPYQ